MRIRTLECRNNCQPHGWLHHRLAFFTGKAEQVEFEDPCGSSWGEVMSPWPSRVLPSLVASCLPGTASPCKDSHPKSPQHCPVPHTSASPALLFPQTKLPQPFQNANDTSCILGSYSFFSEPWLWKWFPVAGRNALNWLHPPTGGVLAH